MPERFKVQPMFSTVIHMSGNEDNDFIRTSVSHSKTREQTMVAFLPFKFLALYRTF